MSDVKPSMRAARRRGLGLPELLIALAISAALLVAAGSALDASFKAYGVNQAQSALSQRARVAMHRILTTIRAAEDHRPDNDEPLDQFHSGLVCTDNAIRMITGDAEGVIFRQEADKLLMVPITISGGDIVEGTAQTLLNGVEAGDFTVTFEPMRSAAQIRTGNPNYDQLKRAGIRMTIRQSDANTVTGDARSAAPLTLSTSVMPRRNFW